MYARTNVIQADPARVEDVLAYIRDEVAPLVRGMEGNVGVSAMVSRDTSRVAVTTMWQSQEAMRASDSAVRDSRQQAGQMAGATPEVTEWEVALMQPERS